MEKVLKDTHISGRAYYYNNPKKDKTAQMYDKMAQSNIITSKGPYNKDLMREGKYDVTASLKLE